MEVLIFVTALVWAVAMMASFGGWFVAWTITGILLAITFEWVIRNKSNRMGRAYSYKKTMLSKMAQQFTFCFSLKQEWVGSDGLEYFILYEESLDPNPFAWILKGLFLPILLLLWGVSGLTLMTAPIWEPLSEKIDEWYKKFFNLK